MRLSFSSSDRKIHENCATSEVLEACVRPVVNMLRKLFWIRFLICSSSEIHSPRVFLIHLILFLFLLTNVETWKKEVFQSPKATQFSLDLSAQYSPSCSLTSNKWVFLYELLLWMRKLLGWSANAFWTPFNRARPFLFLANRFPNTSLFHWLALLVKVGMAELRGISWP